MVLQLFNGPVPVEKTLAAWYADHRTQNYGAFVNFVGTIRAEGEIEGLSFDIYEPILKQWFDRWQQKADKAGAYLCMAHSKGDVGIHESSYIAGVFSPKRRVALEMIDTFVEDFKANAPIWKYDLKNSRRIYAKDRSTPMEGAGLLG